MIGRFFSRRSASRVEGTAGIDPLPQVKCACGRSVAKLPEIALRGLGWDLVAGAWTCPLCSGNVTT